MMKKLYVSIVFLGTLAFATLSLSITNAQARQGTGAQPSGQAFAISPPLLELQADPGQTVYARLKFTNISKDTLYIKTEYNAFGAKDEEDGVPNIIFEDNELTRKSLKSWIAPLAPFMLEVGKTKELSFPINVPSDAEPGGHYAVIQFTGSAADEGGSNVAFIASIAPMVLLRVSGDIKEDASVDFFSAAEDFTKGTFFEYGPVQLVERVHNTGNIHVKPSGTVTVKDMFGKVVSSARVNGTPGSEKSGPKSVLPNSTRRFNQEFQLNNGWMFGRYEATLDLAYGENSAKKLSATTSFWIVPYKLAIIVIVGLVALFFVSRFLIKRYNTHIIKKSRRHR